MKSIILFLLMASPAMAFDVTGNLPTALGDGRYVLKSGDTMSGPLTLAGSSLTVTGSAFSVGGSTLVVSGGKVGIGTASPEEKLEIEGTAATYVRIQTTAGDPTPVGLRLVGGAANTDWTLMTNFSAGLGAADSIGFYKNAGTTGAKLIIRNDGNVGIGDTAPSELLEVAGGIASYSRTMAQLLAITPSQAGVQYFCNNCTPTKMVVSTGTSAGNFADIMGGTFQ